MSKRSERKWAAKKLASQKAAADDEQEWRNLQVQANQPGDFKLNRKQRKRATGKVKKWGW